MRARIRCKKHGARHSAHAAFHCRTRVKAGECLDAKQQPRGERCPIWAARKEA